MSSWIMACMTASDSDEMPSESDSDEMPSESHSDEKDNCLLYREFDARVFLVHALEDEMKQKLDPTDDAGNTQWKEIYEKIDASAKRIDDEKLKNRDRTIVERVISDVSFVFDQGLLEHLQRKHNLSDSLKDCLPSEGQTWQSFLDSKRNQMEKCEDNLMAEGLNSLREFQTVAKRCKDEIDKVNRKIEIMVGDNIESQSMEMQESEAITVFYATDRRKYDEIWNEHNLSYGKKRVSIPGGHQRGKLETPNTGEGPKDKNHVQITGGGTEVWRTEQEFTNAIQTAIQTELGVRDHVLLYIHGFNTSLNHAIRRAAQLTNDLKFKGVVLAYCWPSKGRFWRYSKDAVAVDKTANNLRQVITTLLTEKVQGISQVHILAHSMGTRALINALKDQGQTKAKETKGKGERLRNVILAAADAQRCKFEAMLQVMYPEDAKGKVPQRPIISVYSSAHDSALRISKWLNWEIRLGDTYSLLEMKKWENKVDVVDATGERCAGSRHSYHAEVQDVLNDIQELLTNSRRAKESEVRRSIIKEVASKDKLTFHAFDEDWWTRERLTQGPWMVRW